MSDLLQEVKVNAILLLKTNGVSLTKASKTIIEDHLTQKFARRQLLYSLKSELSKNVFEARIKEEKVFDQLLINLLQIAAKATVQKIIDGFNNILDATVSKVLGITIV